MMRKEKDSLGIVSVPAHAYYGAQTQRAVENFPISGRRINSEFIKSYAAIKKAAALANSKLGHLDARKAKAIERACDEIMAGKLLDQFVVDAYQAGAGTSTNMNVNEVVANRATEMLGGKKGKYTVHPNDHVNMSQSTNDTYHVCIHVSAYSMTKNGLVPALEHLERELAKKAHSFSKIVKVGRTHMQDAVPITLGEEFSGYSDSVRDCRINLERTVKTMLEVSFGGTAVGTGINADKHYSDVTIKELDRITGISFVKSKNFFKETQNQNEETELSGALKSLAIALNKIANDLVLMSSGPEAGLNELELPALQPGSSIMAGKVNPSAAEMLNMVCFQVIGNDLTITEAARSGQLELNVYMPVIAYNLLESINTMANAVNIFSTKCVSGIKANKKRIAVYVGKDSIIATALVPRLGYEKVAEIVKMAQKTGRPVKEIVLKMKLMNKKELDKLLDARKLV